MSSKKAMRQAQKQAYAKHRSNITNSRFQKKKVQIINFDKFISTWDKDQNLVFVTHYVVISEILNYAPSSGEIVISDNTLKVIDTLEIEY